MTNEEYQAVAMLLDFGEYAPRHKVFRKRVAPNAFAGMADFEYRERDAPYKLITRQSEVDRPIRNDPT